MRELEFLPEWYPRFQRKRRFALAQAWVSAALMLVLVVASFLTQHSIRARQKELDGIAKNPEQTNQELQHLDDKIALRKELERQKLVMDSVGRHIESARLLALFGSTIPKEMAFTEMSFDINELTRAQGPLVNSLLGTRKQEIVRKLSVKIKGVTPTDMDVANMLVTLNRYPFFENANLLSSESKTINGYKARQFEVSAQVDLSDSEK